MIEVNLLPGGKKRSSRRKAGSGFALPKMGGVSLDRWTVGSVVVLVAALGWAAFSFLSVRSGKAETQVALDAAVQDSARFSDLIARTALLTARRDSISLRVGIIQKIDQNRFVWPHVLDEISRALPDYTWLSELTQTQTDPLTVRLTGQAGNNYALTTFMEQLEASAFLQGVTLIQSQQEFAGEGANQQVVQGFIMEVTYVQPPMDFLETVPLFEGGTTSTQNEKPDSGAAAPAAPRPGGQG